MAQDLESNELLFRLSPSNLVSQARPNQPKRGSLSVSRTVRDTKSDPRWGWLGLTCETTSNPCSGVDTLGHAGARWGTCPSN